MKSKKLLCLLLSAVMVAFSLSACNTEGGNNNPDNSGDSSNSGNEDPGNNDDNSGDDNTGDDGSDVEPLVISTDDDEVYQLIFGEFNDAYAASLGASSVSERFALMAIAEAKLMETGAMLPTTAQGGNYAISKVVPYTSAGVITWGTDSDRYHNVLVATTPIANEDWDALKALYKNLKGTGTYESEAKAYMEEHGYEFQRTYTFMYSGDNTTYDVLTAYRSVDAEVMVNTYDNLVEYNGEGDLMPALAESWETSADGKTWTFHIRQGVKWVDSTGAEVGEVTADDFVAGFQHMLDDPTTGLSDLVWNVIVGVDEYYDTEDFSVVGVEATDDYTLVYTLQQAVSYFDTMLTYNPFAPMNRAYYESQGGQFGIAADAGNYGIDKDHVAYCGPYIISSHIDLNTYVFDKNEAYWNKDNINIDKITWLYNDGSDATRAYNEFVDGNIDGVGLNSAATTLARDDGNFDLYAHTTSPNATSFPGFFNMNRKSWVNFNDEVMVSGQTDEQKELAHAAMQSQNFRLALCFAVDRASYNEASVGSELKLVSLINSYTPGTFVSLPEDVTVSINGEDKTYAAGTYYGQIMQDQITADGYPIQVFDPNGDGGVGSGTGFDGWYNPANAKKYLDLAIEELAASGYEVSAENPVHLDLACLSDGDVYTAMNNVIKQSVEEASEGRIIIDLVTSSDVYEWYYATYFNETGAEANYDLQFNSGWGPDYGDPSTFLDTVAEGGVMVKNFGID